MLLDLEQEDHPCMQDSPNPRGILGSKASGEPSLLLSTSILYALRQAVVAAQKGLAAERSLSSKANPIAVRNGNSASGEDPFFVLAAPATTVRLKQVQRRCRALVLTSSVKLGRVQALKLSGD